MYSAFNCFCFRPELIKPATLLYPHNLSSILESAIRVTNAQFEDADILNRLDVRLLEQSPGDTGWDVFSLDYHVDGPIGTVSLTCFTYSCFCLCVASIF
jgi:gamma-tubulin complex component 3